MRLSRPSMPDEEPTPILSKIGCGCAVAIATLVLGVGALGLVFGVSDRIAGWGDGDGDVDEGGGDTNGDGVVDEGDGPLDPYEPPDPVRRPPSMRDRYHPGPFVTVESMVESGRILNDATFGGPTPGVRTVDTPWVVPGAELRVPPMPAPGAGGPRVSHDPGERVDRALSVLPRTPSRVQVRARDASGGTAISGYLVDFVGYPGHFWLPATVPTELGTVQAGGSDGATVYFAINAPVQPNGVALQRGQRFMATMRVASVDDQGHASAPVSRQLEVLSVGAGDVEVTLTMGEATDMDLYVADPTGNVIYYGNTSSGTGGHLDLDANAACSGNLGVDNEHIYWPAGQAPVGTYRLQVAHYESCIQGRPVAYRVTVRACGETVVLTGQFDGRANSSSCTAPATPEQRFYCQEVVRFDMPGCAPQ